MAAPPLSIADDELIVRGICSPYHVKKGRLQPGAYEPPYDDDRVSVIRHDYGGTDYCKRKAKELEKPEQKKIYRGLAILSAQQIRENRTDVLDSREVYKFHADIVHGIVRRRNEPSSSPETVQLRETAKDLARAAKYLADPEPSRKRWTGPEIEK